MPSIVSDIDIGSTALKIIFDSGRRIPNGRRFLDLNHDSGGNGLPILRVQNLQTRSYLFAPFSEGKAVSCKLVLSDVMSLFSVASEFTQKYIDKLNNGDLSSDSTYKNLLGNWMLVDVIASYNITGDSKLFVCKISIDLKFLDEKKS